MFRFELPVNNFRNMKSLFEEDKNIKRCYCYVAITDLPDGLKICIKKVDDIEDFQTEKIIHIMESNSENLHLYAPKIVINADKYVFDNRKNKLTVEIDIEKNQGVIYGAITLYTVLANKNSIFGNTPNGKMYVELELFMGLSDLDIENIELLRRLR